MSSNYSTIILQTAPLAYWRLDNSASPFTDTSGNGYSATASNVVYQQTGAMAYDTDTAVGFPSTGIGAIVLPTTSTFIFTGAFTYEAWVYTANSTSTYFPFFGSATATGTTNYAPEISINGTGYVQATVYTAAGMLKTLTGRVTTTYQVWHHIVLTYTGSVLALYIDGSLNTQLVLGTTLLTNSNQLGFLGYSNVSGYSLIGSLDEVALYNVALSATTIHEHYIAGIVNGLSTYAQAVLVDTPAGYWRMDSTSGTSLTDYSVNSLNGTATSTTGITLQQTSALTSDSDYSTTFVATGSSEYLLPTSAALTFGGPFTLEFWLYNNVPDNATYGILGYDPGTIGSRAPSVSVINGTALFYGMGTTSGSWLSIQSANNVVPKSTWTYVTIVWDGANFLLYTNGVLINTTNEGSFTPAMTPIREIGGNNNGTSFLTGSLDEVAVYASALSALHIRRHYIASSGLWLSIFQDTATSILTKQIYTTISETGRSINSLQRSFSQYLGSIYGQVIVNDSPIAFYRMDDTSGTVLTDQKTTTLNGTIHGTATYAQTGLLKYDIDTAMGFNGTNTYAQTPLNASGWETISIECWIKPASVSGNPRLIAEDHSDVNNLGFGLTLQFFSVGNGISQQGANSNYTYTVGSIYHIVGVYTGSVIQYYVNGALQGTFPQTGAIGTSTYPISIGYDPATSADYFNGIIDEVAIYSYPLTTTQVVAHYAAGAYTKINFNETATGTEQFGHRPQSQYSKTIIQDTPTAYYRMDETSGNLHDVEHGYYPATAQGSLVYGAASTLIGDTDSAITFNGSNTGFVLSNNYSPAGLTTFSVEAWVRLNATTTTQRIVSNSHTDIDSNGFQLAQSFFSIGNGSYPQTVNSSLTWTTGKIYYLVGTYDGTTVRFYVNGVQAAFGGMTGAISVSGYATVIGYNGGNGTDRFSGDIDEVALYAYTLTPTQIAAHYQAGLSPQIADTGQGQEKFHELILSAYSAQIRRDGAVAYYRMDESAGQLEDVATSFYGSTAVANLTYGTTGLINNDPDTAITFNGTSSTATLNVGLDPYGKTAFSVEAWINPSSVVSNQRILANNHTDSTLRGFQLALGFFDVGNSYTVGTANSNTTFVTGIIYHLVGTYDGTNVRYYVNGIQKGIGSLTGPVSNSANPMSLGYNATYNGDFFGGVIDEVAFYYTALSASQVAYHYELGTQRATLDTGTGTESFSIATYFPGYALSLNALRYYPLDASSGIVLRDLGSQHQAGTLTGTWTYGVIGALRNNTGTALATNGTSAVATLPTTGLPTGAQAFTLACFVQSLGAPTATVPLAQFGTWGTSNAYLALALTTSQQYIVTSGGATITGTTAQSGIWHFLVAVYNGTTLSFYDQGVLQGSVVVTLNLGTTAATLGGISSASLYAYAQLQAAVIWNTALTSTQISQLTAMAYGSFFRDQGTGSSETFYSSNRYNYYSETGRGTETFIGLALGHWTETGTGTESFLVKVTWNHEFYGNMVPGTVQPGNTNLPIMTNYAPPNHLTSVPLTFAVGPSHWASILLTGSLQSRQLTSLPLSFVLTLAQLRPAIAGSVNFPAPETIQYRINAPQYLVDGTLLIQGSMTMIWSWQTMTTTEVAALISLYQPAHPRVLISYPTISGTYVQNYGYMEPLVLGQRQTIVYQNVQLLITQLPLDEGPSPHSAT